MGNALFGEVLTRDEVIARRRLELSDAIQELGMEIATTQVAIGKASEALRSAASRQDKDEEIEVAKYLRRNMIILKQLQAAKTTLNEADMDVDKLHKDAVLSGIVVDAARSLAGANRLSSLTRFQAVAASFKSNASDAHRLAVSNAGDITPDRISTPGKKGARRAKRKAEDEEAQLTDLIAQARRQVSTMPDPETHFFVAIDPGSGVKKKSPAPPPSSPAQSSVLSTIPSLRGEEDVDIPNLDDVHTAPYNDVDKELRKRLDALRRPPVD
jgi:hypothetical protein